MGAMSRLTDSTWQGLDLSMVLCNVVDVLVL